jgi:hypothetical protein
VTNDVLTPLFELANEHKTDLALAAVMELTPAVWKNGSPIRRTILLAPVVVKNLIHGFVEYVTALPPLITNEFAVELFPYSNEKSVQPILVGVLSINVSYFAPTVPPTISKHLGP